MILRFYQQVILKFVLLSRYHNNSVTLFSPMADLLCSPPPHETVQGLQALHSPHTPADAGKAMVLNKFLLCNLCSFYFLLTVQPFLLPYQPIQKGVMQIGAEMRPIAKLIYGCWVWVQHLGCWSVLLQHCCLCICQAFCYLT